MTEHQAQRPGTDVPDASGEQVVMSQEARLRTLEDQVTTLTAAVHALSSGLRNVSDADAAPTDEAARGARLAHEILFSRGM